MVRIDWFSKCIRLEIQAPRSAKDTLPLLALALFFLFLVPLFHFTLPWRKPSTRTYVSSNLILGSLAISKLVPQWACRLSRFWLNQNQWVWSTNIQSKTIHLSSYAKNSWPQKDLEIKVGCARNSHWCSVLTFYSLILWHAVTSESCIRLVWVLIKVQCPQVATPYQASSRNSSGGSVNKCNCWWDS